MLRLALADLRRSLRVWAGAFVLLAVSATILAWMSALATIGLANIDPAALVAELEREDLGGINLAAMGLASSMVTTGLFLLIVVAAMVAAVGAQAIEQQRRTLALWQLAGMSDFQLGVVLLVQMAALAMLASLCGALAGWLSLPAVIAYATDNQLVRAAMSLRAAPLGAIAGGLLAVAISLAGMFAACWRVRRIGAIEALHPVDPPSARMTALNWLWLAVSAAATLMCALAMVIGHGSGDLDSLALLLMLLLCASLHAAGPLLVPAWTAAWSARMPGAGSPMWRLARCALDASQAHLIGSAIPVAITVVLAVGLLSLQASQARAAGGAGQGASVFSMIVLVGMPMTVSVVGASVMAFMSSLRRDREVALSALAGATPRQQLLQALFESAIVVASGVGLGLICVALVLACYQPYLFAKYGHGGFAVAGEALAWVVALVWLANLTACVVPVAMAQRQAPTRLLAER